MSTEGPVTIRKGLKEDCEGMTHLIGELGRHEAHAKWITDVDRLREDGFGDRTWYETFVAEAEDQSGSKVMVGMALYYYSYSMLSGRCSHLEVLYVEPDWRKQRLGIKLCRAVVQDVLDNGCTSLEISALEKNARAMNFYKSLGAIDFTEKAGARMLMLGKPEMEAFATSC